MAASTTSFHVPHYNTTTAGLLCRFAASFPPPATSASNSSLTPGLAIRIFRDCDWRAGVRGCVLDFFRAGVSRRRFDFICERWREPDKHVLGGARCCGRRRRDAGVVSESGVWPFFIFCWKAALVCLADSVNAYPALALR